MNWIKKADVSDREAGWREIGISREKRESADRMYFSVRISEGWNMELTFRLGNDIL